MSLYVTGTITGALNATTITGTGTKWSDAKFGITNGSVLFVSSNAGVDGVYQVKRVISDTSIELAQPIYKTFTNSKYSILVAESASTAAWSNQLAATLGYYQAQMDGWQQIMTGTGDVALTAPDGTKVTIKSFTALDKNKADKSSLGTSSTMDVMVNTVDTSPKTPIMIKGGFGVGGYGVGTSWAYTAEGALVSSPNGAPISGTVHHGIVCAHASDPAYGFQIAGRFDAYVRFKNAGTFTQWRKVYDNGNTTVTSDGVIKVSSPVINIFHDGKFEVNAESEGAIVKREGVGVYRISGVLGMNSDGAWGGIDGGFDIPKDRNGQRLVWLDYKVEADGSVLVKTYHRTYPDAPAFARNVKDGYEEGDLIDIPSDQFVSVRVEMPQDSIWNLAQKAAQEEMAQEEIAEE